ncbi:hypothetical protein LO872_004151 [Vibrio fluvialis]|nr:hypothetical protein [Vibrio fluvialis]
MSNKPDRLTAMQQIIDAVQQEFPLYQQDTFVCGPNNTCVGCPKKLMELVDSELSYWQHQVKRGLPPSFDELNRFGKLCKNVRRALVRNGRIAVTERYKSTSRGSL